MSELVLLAGLTLLGSGTVAALVAGMFGRRKISAEATEIVTRAAGEQVGRLQAELDKQGRKILALEQENESLERRLDRFERREMQHRDLLQTHSAWDWRVSEALRRRLTAQEMVDEQIDPAPPLYPPN